MKKRKLYTIILTILLILASFMVRDALNARAEGTHNDTKIHAKGIEKERIGNDSATEKHETENAEVKEEAKEEKAEKTNIKTHKDEHSHSTADHSKFKVLQADFKNGQEVTKACLKCHNKAGEQFMHSIHWTWQYKHPKTGQILGKRTAVNNFCTNARGNEGMCAQCHAAYNHKDYEFDYKNPVNIDCLACHDQTGTYFKTLPSKPHEAVAAMFESKKKPFNWNKVAQSVGEPTRSNCGSCHFYGGGGDNVKHGDLSSALKMPDKSVDVHMDKNGLNFACQKCHVTEEHIISGSRYQMVAVDRNGRGKPGEERSVASCESCHGTSPHNRIKGIKGIKLNGHVDRVACETCHIPEFAKGGVATKTYWDWSTAGKLDENGKGYKIKGYTQGNGAHRPTYKSLKGDLEYGENLKPMYAWFDGTMRYTTVDTKFDPADAPIEINHFNGSYDDPNSRIWPFKRMHSKQAYDSVNNTLVYMQIWGQNDVSFWGNYDFQKAIEYGMKKAEKPFSGKYGFIETYSYWPITHMVAPAENALACSECHSKNGRLSNLKGFYMPGRDNWKWLDMLGWAAVFGALLISVIHASARYVMRKRRKKQN